MICVKCLEKWGGELVIFASPLVRGEWIEIPRWKRKRNRVSSPLVRGEWIEITIL